MGAWSTSINGNDLAMDMRSEYSVAFSRHEPKAAVALLDAYMHRSSDSHDETDGDWVDYRYSLADYMWKKGVLYDELRDEVIGMIDRGAALDLYDNAKLLRKREKCWPNSAQSCFRPSRNESRSVSAASRPSRCSTQGM